MAAPVHPETYGVVDTIGARPGLRGQGPVPEPRARQNSAPALWIDKVGLPTLNDDVAELAKPGRDPRQISEFAFQQGIDKVEDLEPGMKLPGIVTM